ncbi:MAG: hypothetical protein KC609_21185 [Myxococcales bacterium]|nr:hypothetical protein [Myxococcales bacterium]
MCPRRPTTLALLLWLLAASPAASPAVPPKRGAPTVSAIAGQIDRLRRDLGALQRANLAGVDARRLFVHSQRVRAGLTALATDVQRAYPRWGPRPKASPRAASRASSGVQRWRDGMLMQIARIVARLDRVEATILLRLRRERGTVTREVVKMGRSLGLLARHAQ